MSVTLSTVRTIVRENLEEPSARAWTDAELDRWINEGCRDIARITECLRASTTVAVTGGTQTYTGPTDIVRIYRVQWEPTGSTQKYPLEPREINTLDSVWWTSQSISTGTPQFFYTWGFPPSVTIGLYPTPTVNGNLRVFYARLSADVTNGATTLDIPEGWHDAVAEYATYRALRRARDPRWQESYARYTETASNLMATSAGPGAVWTTAPGLITPRMPVGYPAWLYGDTDGW